VCVNSIYYENIKDLVCRSDCRAGRAPLEPVPFCGSQLLPTPELCVLFVGLSCVQIPGLQGILFNIEIYMIYRTAGYFI